ncbi:hypothetical protein B0I35DRAFT_51148 [Stachybotrys elegans]|uniref:Uncharacterized protein n=1 Tax=Stachybotrys elegans TaxID=80388 RepID=A0A8K0WN89_9HYPO|nr:hypothetical protein B0I35DRAFT_51148 [Stachybotrys elegans]
MLRDGISLRRTSHATASCRGAASPKITTWSRSCLVFRAPTALCHTNNEAPQRRPRSVTRDGMPVSVWQAVCRHTEDDEPCHQWMGSGILAVAALQTSSGQPHKQLSLGRLSGASAFMTNSTLCHSREIILAKKVCWSAGALEEKAFVPNHKWISFRQGPLVLEPWSFVALKGKRARSSHQALPTELVMRLALALVLDAWLPGVDSKRARHCSVSGARK